jgi:sensor histidine kinase YesM
LLIVENLWIFFTGFATLYLIFISKGKTKLYGIPMGLISLSGCLLFNYIRYAVVHLPYDPAIYKFKDIAYITTQNYNAYFIYSIGNLLIVRYIQKQKEVRIFERRQLEDEQARLQLEKQSALLMQEKLLLEKDLLQSENNFLRAQISPHFLYNCLNFFYSEVFEQQPRVGEAVLLLAQIMRYSLTDFSATNGLASLHAEIDHIRNVIEMHQMRFAQNLQLEFSAEGNLTDKLIAPMILMTLVENVLKHGDLHDPSFPARIQCKVDTGQKMICFSIKNKKGKAQSPFSSGIGHENLQQRLTKLFGDNFRLVISDQTNVYWEELWMPYFDRLHAPEHFSKPKTVLSC